MTWQKVVFCLWGDTEEGEEEQEGLCSPPFSCLCFFPSFSSYSLSFSPFFLHLLSQVSLSQLLSPSISLSPSLLSVLKYESFVQYLPRPTFPPVKKRKKKSKTNHSDALLNLINEAWETWSHNTLVSIKEHKGTDYCQMLLDVSEQRGHTHVIPLGLGRHCLFDGCQQSSHSVWLTVLWHHREWRKRYSLYEE